MRSLPIHLIRHPKHPCDAVSKITFEVERLKDGLAFRYDLRGDIAQLEMPRGQGGQRRDELWKTTCFEAFIGEAPSHGYAEFNFAPNGDWAGYEFSGYREQARDLDTASPEIQIQSSADHLSVLARVSAAPDPFYAHPVRIGPAVIIETLDGRLSYWALHHPTERPDFHLAENFQIRLD